MQSSRIVFVCAQRNKSLDTDDKQRLLEGEGDHDDVSRLALRVLVLLNLMEKPFW